MAHTAPILQYMIMNKDQNHFRRAMASEYAVQHDGIVSNREVVVVSGTIRSTADSIADSTARSEGDVRALAQDFFASTVGLIAYSSQTMWALTETTTRTVVGSVLDRIVPSLTDAIVARMDLTGVVLRNVDLRAVVTAALDEMDLTSIVLERVDVDQIVARTDVEAIIDRVPMLQIADYIIEEIDLPQIIRESTGGIAIDAFTTTRFSAARSDEFISKVVDGLLLRRRRRDLSVDHTLEPEPSAAEGDR